MSRPHLTVLPGGRESESRPSATGAANEDRDRLRLASQALRTLSECWQAVRVAEDGSITVTFDKRAALAVRFLMSWKRVQS